MGVRFLFALLLCLMVLGEGKGQAQRPLPWLYHAAYARWGQGDSRGAIRALDSLRAAGKRLPYEVYHLYTLAYLREGDSDSVSYYLQLAGGRSASQYSLLAASVACQQGRVRDGIELLRGYLSSRPAVPERKLRSDTLLRPCSNGSEWAELWLKEWYSPAQVLDDDLSQRAEEGNWHYLLERLDRMSPYARRRPKYAHLRALALRGLGDYASAFDLARRNAKRKPREESYARLAAELALECDQPERAVRLIAAYQSYDPGNPHLLPALARAQLAMGQPRGAYATAIRYLSLYPRAGGALYVAAESAVRGGMWMQALERIAELLPIASADTVVALRMLRARVHLALSQPRLALDELADVVRAASADSVVFALMAACYDQLGERAKECRALERAASLGHGASQERMHAKCPHRAVGADAGIP